MSKQMKAAVKLRRQGKKPDKDDIAVDRYIRSQDKLSPEGEEEFDSGIEDYLEDPEDFESGEDEEPEDYDPTDPENFERELDKDLIKAKRLRAKPEILEIYGDPEDTDYDPLMGEEEEEEEDDDDGDLAPRAEIIDDEKPMKKKKKILETEELFRGDADPDKEAIIASLTDSMTEDELKRKPRKSLTERIMQNAYAMKRLDNKKGRA